MTADLLLRKRTHFVLWSPQTSEPAPRLIIGELLAANPVGLVNERALDMVDATGSGSLWELAAADAGLVPGTTYHYWFEVTDRKPGRPVDQRIWVTDPAAWTVDWRLRPRALPAPNGDEDRQPAAVVTFDGEFLIAADPGGERATLDGDSPSDRLPPNNRLVIYELPTTWARIGVGGGLERGIGTFQDVLALLDSNHAGASFADLGVTELGRAYLVDLGINAIEFLPPADSAVTRDWGYATTNYHAPDFDLGFPDANSSPTAHRDLVALVSHCHGAGIRVFADMVMAFWRDGSYEHIDPDNFHIFDPDHHRDDPDAWTSTRGFGTKQVRDGFGSTLIRYAKVVDTYDPVSGQQASISPGGRYMLVQLERWMRDYHIDGVRLDSVENVYNWDFIQEFTDRGRELWRERWNAAGLGGGADARFLVVGEELSLPMGLLRQNRLDALWNDRFREYVRAALLGESAGAESFEATVRTAIDCRQFGFSDGAQAVNYLTSHDVEGYRKERLWTFLDRSGVRGPDQKTKRIKLAFACLLTAVGIPMILAGEEFGDQHDLFDSAGNVSQNGGKQTDPVNFSRADDPSRSGLLPYVARLVKLRTTHAALSVNDTAFLHVDLGPDRRVVVWQRGRTDDPVVVVANFSDFGSERTADGFAEYRIPNWPGTPPGKRWRDVSQDRDVPAEWVAREPLFAWEAKVYALVVIGD